MSTFISRTNLKGRGRGIPALVILAALGVLALYIAFTSFGSSNNVAASHVPENCQQVLAQSPGSTDGEYVISPYSQTFSVYCHGMAGGTPTEYLSLQNVGGDYNFGQYTVGGAVSGTSVRTNYEKIRFDISTFLVDVGDRTFATSTGSLLHDGNSVTSMSYATAMNCDYREATGLANVDLTGLPFVLNDPFEAYGDSLGGVSFSSGDQVADITGGGFCGWFSPAPSWYAPNLIGGGFILNLKFIGVVEASFHETINAIDGKVDALGSKIDLLDTGNLDATVSSRASQASVDALGTPASQSSVDSLGTPASQSSVDALGTPASQSSADAIEGKLDSGLNATVSSRATQTSITALEVKIDALEDQLDAVLSALQAIEIQIDNLPIGGQGSGGAGGGRP